MVQEDYLGEIQRLKLQEGGHAMGQDVPVSSPPSSALSKYGTWIQELPSVEDLERIFLPPTPIGQNDLLAADELLLHLLKRCSPDVRVACMSRFLRMDHDSDSLRRAIVDFTLPRLHHLCIRITFESPRPGLSKLMNLLDRCSTILKKLELSINIKSSGGNYDRHAEEEQPMGERNDWVSLKELLLHNFTESVETRSFWSWVFRRCGQVAKLEVRSTIGTAQNLSQDMLTHMPNLTEITLGSSHPSDFGLMNDDKVADLLSGSRKGWRILIMSYSAEVGTMAIAALLKHSSTLEALIIERCERISKAGLTRVLSTCPNLHTLCDYDLCPEFNVEEFGDRDPVTRLLRPWKCEPTLKALKLIVHGTPISYIWADDIDHLVFDRLARLTKLEKLFLGEPDVWKQPDCPRMSLESGLHKLSGLKMLKELGVSCMRTRIGVEEVQWMIEHWPRLQTIRGLDENGADKKVVGWLRDNHPEIKVLG
ncbi:hypothetical protein BGX34_004383 [Mortierella sp. NVP85]|nr:hypothetical protein BGX34_004383 [Mortierella sp. NVP85]